MIRQDILVRSACARSFEAALPEIGRNLFGQCVDQIRQPDASNSAGLAFAKSGRLGLERLGRQAIVIRTGPGLLLRGHKRLDFGFLACRLSCNRRPRRLLAKPILRADGEASTGVPSLPGTAGGADRRGVYQGSRRFPVGSKRGGASQIREPRERVRPAITTRGSLTRFDVRRHVQPHADTLPREPV